MCVYASSGAQLDARIMHMLADVCRGLLRDWLTFCSGSSSSRDLALAPRATHSRTDLPPGRAFYRSCLTQTQAKMREMAEPYVANGWFVRMDNATAVRALNGTALLQGECPSLRSMPLA